MPSKLPVLAVLLLLASLLLAASAGHAASAPPVLPFALEELEAGEEGEYEETECEIAWEEFEEGLLTEFDLEELCAEGNGKKGKAGKSGKGSAARGECVLRSVRAHAASKYDKLKVTVGYTTVEPVNATIKVRNGSIHDTYKRHLGKSGVLRFTEPLRGKEPKQRTEVRLKLPNGNAGCPSRRLVLFPK